MGLLRSNYPDIKRLHSRMGCRFETFVGIFKDDDTFRLDSHAVCRFQVDIRRRLGACYLFCSNDSVKKWTQAGCDQRRFNVLSHSIGGNRHRNHSKPMAGYIGDGSNLLDEMKIRKKALIRPPIEIFTNESFDFVVCLIGIEKIIRTQPRTHAVPLRVHRQPERREGLPNCVQMRGRTIHKGSITIEDQSVETSSFQFEGHC